MSETIRILLADDHPLVRSGIRSTIAEEPDLELIAEATDAHEVQRLCELHQPDILLLDLSMPGPSPLETIAFVKESCVKTRVLVLTAYDDDVYVRSVVKAGVAGYLLKDEAVEALVSAIHAVVKGGTWFSRRVVDKMFEWHNDPTQSALSELTNREREILEVIGQGWDNRKIASELNLAEQTVRNYVSRIYDKLNLHSRAEVIVWARKHGFGGS